MDKLAFLLFIICAVKAVIIILLTRSLKNLSDDILEVIVSSWIILYVSQIGILILLSIWNLIYLEAIALYHICLILVLLLYIRGSTDTHLLSISSINFTAALRAHSSVICLIIIIFFILTSRSLLFFDTTWDGLTYELPRIFMYASNHSLFVHQSTQMVNIFCNEWNGELNSLFYTVVTGDDQAASFGNVEIWLFGILAYTWITHRFGLTYKWSLFCALVILLSPISLALAMTVKGDLLAFITLPLLVCWYVKVIESENDYLALSMLVICAGLAAGSKVSILPSCLMLLACTAFFMQWSFRENRNWTFWSIAIGGLGFLIGTSRYIINIIVYHNPFQRLEVVSHDAFNIVQTLIGISNNFAKGIYSPIFELLTSSNEQSWALDKGFGMLAAFIVASPLIALYQMKHRTFEDSMEMHKKAALVLPFLIIATNFLILSFSAPWYPWSPRYYAPFLTLALVYALVFTIIKSSILQRKILTTILVFILIAHCFENLRIREVWPSSFATAYKRSQQERKLAFHPYYYNHFGLNRIEEVIWGGGKVLILNQVDSAIEPFFGPNHSNIVELCKNAEELVARSRNGNFDLIVVTLPGKQVVNEKEIMPFGYFKSVSNEWWDLYSRKIKEKRLND